MLETALQPTKGRCVGLAQRARIAAQKKKQKPNLRTAYKLNKSECTQTAWLEYAEGVLAAGIGCKLGGSDGQQEAGLKVQLEARDVHIQKKLEITQRQRINNKNPAWGCLKCVHP